MAYAQLVFQGREPKFGRVALEHPNPVSPFERVAPKPVVIGRHSRPAVRTALARTSLGHTRAGRGE